MLSTNEKCKNMILLPFYWCCTVFFYCYLKDSMMFEWLSLSYFLFVRLSNSLIFGSRPSINIPGENNAIMVVEESTDV